MFSDESTAGKEMREGPVAGFLHQPAELTNKALVLTHGAGGNCRSPLLVTVASAFCRAGYAVLRCDLRFRQRRAFGPPMPAMAEADRAALKEAAGLMRASGFDRVFLGGHSYGGRQASMLAATTVGVCDGLLVLSYPLHPPKKPNNLRTGHFPELQPPALFVHGTIDPFGSIEEMRAAIQVIPARTELILVEGAGHDLRRGQFDVAKLIVNSFETLL